jgi:hypothetical protein
MLNLLHPDGDPASAPAAPPGAPGRLVHVVDAEMAPPAGRERLVAVWSVRPLPLRLDQLHGLVGQDGGRTAASRRYATTRDIRRVEQAVQQLRPEDWHAVVVELDHEP